MRVVAALGGNALLRRGESLDAGTQRQNVQGAAQVLSGIAREHTLIVTHGNGPQVGLLALQAEAYDGVPPYPLDVLGAETEGMIGYLLEQELRNLLPDHDIATLLTQVEVDAKDSALATPSKPIGAVYTESQAQRLSETRGWSVEQESSGGFRRVVPSPEPVRILEIATIEILVEAGVLTVCAGGGGVPVARSDHGHFEGIEAVVDKDLASSLLATELSADVLLLLTDQPAVFVDWPDPAREPLRCAGADVLRALSLDPGSMGPKVEAACRFVESTGARAGIGALWDAPRVLGGSAGTQVVPQPPERQHGSPENG